MSSEFFKTQNMFWVSIFEVLVLINVVTAGEESEGVKYRQRSAVVEEKLTSLRGWRWRGGIGIAV